MGVLVFGMLTGTATVSLYNGLAIPVRVTIDGNTVNLEPLQSASIDVEPGIAHKVVTHTADGELIESFDSERMTGRSHFTYNVASAAPLIQWWAEYGGAKGDPDRMLGTQRWSATDADFVLQEPPSTIQTKSHQNGGLRSVVTAMGDRAPRRQIELVGDDEQVRAMILAHARWDAPGSRNLTTWLAMAGRAPDILPSVIAERLKRYPEDVAALRMEQDLHIGQSAGAACERQTQMAASKPESSSLAYLAVRCMADGPEQDEAFLAGQRRWPQEPWFAHAAGYVLAARSDWTAANEAWSRAATSPATSEFAALE
ncbi:MAG: hypothetical protein ACREOX_12525, partial [Stenotrophomonas sp.]